MPCLLMPLAVGQSPRTDITTRTCTRNHPCQDVGRVCGRRCVTYSTPLGGVLHKPVQNTSLRSEEASPPETGRLEHRRPRKRQNFDLWKVGRSRLDSYVELAIESPCSRALNVGVWGQSLPREWEALSQLPRVCEKYTDTAFPM